jgi:ABC-2 type transport system ATP-binding protein
VTEHAHAAGIGTIQAREDGDQRGLARAVGTQQAEKFALLEFGEVVALDRTANLLSQFAGLQLVLSFSNGTLPASLEGLRQPGNHGERSVRLRLSGYGEVEQILSTCRQAGCEIDDMEVAKADLEDVFVQIMRREGGIPAVPQTPETALEPAA